MRWRSKVWRLQAMKEYLCDILVMEILEDDIVDGFPAGTKMKISYLLPDYDKIIVVRLDDFSRSACLYGDEEGQTWIIVDQNR